MSNENRCYGNVDGWRWAFEAERGQMFECGECGRRFDRLASGQALPRHEQPSDHA